VKQARSYSLFLFSARRHSAAVREHGIQQFLAIFQRVRVRANDVLKWGDEVRAGAAAERRRRSAAAVQLP
jgi:hypothetical protein